MQLVCWVTKVGVTVNGVGTPTVTVTGADTQPVVVSVAVTVYVPAKRPAYKAPTKSGAGLVAEPLYQLKVWFAVEPPTLPEALPEAAGMQTASTIEVATSGVIVLSVTDLDATAWQPDAMWVTKTVYVRLPFKFDAV